MKTSTYNPSSLEIDFANALQILREDIQKHLHNDRITKIENHRGKDNPLIKFNMVDNDGDAHALVVRMIQIPDKF